MTITARYASTCPTCSKRIAPGQSVEWTKGSPARHTSCPSAADGVPTATYLGRVLVADMPRGRGRGPLSNGDIYTDRRTGEEVVFGCAGCRRAGRMCKQCAFDEYDN